MGECRSGCDRPASSGMPGTDSVSYTHLDVYKRQHMIYAAQAFQIEEIPFGIKITAPTKRIESRADALDTPVITTLITSAGENILSVCSYHYQGYQRKDPVSYTHLDDPPPGYAEPGFCIGAAGADRSVETASAVK